MLVGAGTSAVTFQPFASTNTASAIVQRDASGNFAAGTITANLTGNVTGSASNNVLKTGDTMSGALTMNAQNQVRFADADSSNYVALQSPTTIGTNYTLTLPTSLGSVNQVLTTDASGNLSWSSVQPLDSTLTALAAYNTNGLLTQTAADTFTGRTITGTTNQVIVTNGNGVSGNPTLSLPQDIHTAATPIFAGLTLSGFGTGIVHANASGVLSSSLIVDGDVSSSAAIARSKIASGSANHVVINDGSGNLSSEAALSVTRGGTGLSTLTSGQLLVGAGTSAVTFQPFASTNTASTIVQRDGSGNFAAGTITANLTGNVTGSASNNVLKTGDTMSGALTMNAQNQVRFADADSSNYVALQSPTTIGTNYTLTLPTSLGLVNQVLTTDASGNLSWSSVQPLDSTLTALAAYNTNGLLTQTAADTFTGRTITGTTNQVIVTNGNGISGNPTLSLPQDIHTGATPTFAGLNLTGLTVSQAVVTDASKNLASLAYTSANTANAIVQRDGSGNFVAGTITLAATSADTNARNLDFTKNRSGAVITSGDRLGTITFQGFDGASMIIGSQIRSNSSGTIATNRVASNLEFYTHPDSTVASTQRVVISSAGNVTINSPDSGVGLTISGGGLTSTGTTTLSSLASAGLVHTNISGVLSTSLLVDADVSSSAAIARSKIASGSANHVVINDGSGNLSSEAALSVSRGGTGLSTLTSGQLLVGAGTSAVTFQPFASTNTASAIVQRDGSGNFAAGTITANLTGNVTVLLLDQHQIIC